MSRQAFFFEASLGGGVTHYINPCSGWIDNVDNGAEMLFPTPGKIGYFNFVVGTAPGSGKTYTFEMWKNHASTGITASISGSTQKIAFISEWLTIAQGDVLTIQHTESGSPPSQVLVGYCTWVPDVDNYSLIVASCRSNLTNAINTSEYIGGFGLNGGHSSAAAPRHIVIPTPGTLRKYTAILSAEPNTTRRDFWLQRNGSRAMGPISYVFGTGTDVVKTTLSDQSLAVVAGDTLVFESTTSTIAPPAAYVEFCVVFEPDNADEFIVPFTGINNLTGAGNKHIPPYTGEDQWQTFASTRMVHGDIDFLNMYIDLQTSPGSGNSRRFVLLHNGPTSLDKTISGAATTGNITSTVSLIEQGRITLRQIPSSNPNSTFAAIACTAKFNNIKRGPRLGPNY